MGTDNLHHKRRQGRQTRKENEKALRQQTWLIVTEGAKTEPNYFDGLIKSLNASGKELIKHRICGLGKSTKSLVESIGIHGLFDHYDKHDKLSIIPYSKIIFVFDKDSFPSESFNTAIKMAKERYPTCIVAWSNESFELWLNLHFNYINSGPPRQQYNKKLTDIFRDKSIFTPKQSYDKHGKNMDNLFEAVHKAGGSLSQGMKHAEMLEKDFLHKNNPAKSNPVTMVHKAVQALIKESEG